MNTILKDLTYEEQINIEGGSPYTYAAGWLLGAAVAGFLNVADDIRALNAKCEASGEFPPR